MKRLLFVILFIGPACFAQSIDVVIPGSKKNPENYVSLPAGKQFSAFDCYNKVIKLEGYAKFRLCC